MKEKNYCLVSFTQGFSRDDTHVSYKVPVAKLNMLLSFEIPPLYKIHFLIYKAV